MDMACLEIPGTVQGDKDFTILSDHRVIKNLLEAEKAYIPSMNYFIIQSDIKPFMRKVVTQWMLEVCEEQKCEDSVLPLAVNIMDRFMCACVIKRQDFQLLGASCLLIASKLRCCNQLGVDLLCAYTDNSVTAENIQSWELLILSKLQWEMSAITGFDYVDQVIGRCSWGNDSTLLRRHSNTLVSVCYTGKFLGISPIELYQEVQLGLMRLYFTRSQFMSHSFILQGNYARRVVNN
nr:G1/S-specific cyclin-D2-like [Onthophagus taurus]